MTSGRLFFQFYFRFSKSGDNSFAAKIGAAFANCLQIIFLILNSGLDMDQMWMLCKLSWQASCKNVSRDRRYLVVGGILSLLYSVFLDTDGSYTDFKRINCIVLTDICIMQIAGQYPVFFLSEFTSFFARINLNFKVAFHECNELIANVRSTTHCIISPKWHNRIGERASSEPFQWIH